MPEWGISLRVSRITYVLNTNVNPAETSHLMLNHADVFIRLLLHRFQDKLRSAIGISGPSFKCQALPLEMLRKYPQWYHPLLCPLPYLFVFSTTSFFSSFLSTYIHIQHKCTRTQTGYGCCNTVQVFTGCLLSLKAFLFISSFIDLFSICSYVHAVALSCQTLHAHCTSIHLIWLFGSDIALFFESLQYSN